MLDKKKRLTKTDLAKEIADLSNISVREATRAINAFLSGVTQILSDGDKITLVGFGRFEIRHSHERAGRNPATGEPVVVKAFKRACFKPSQVLSKKVNEMELASVEE